MQYLYRWLIQVKNRCALFFRVATIATIATIAAWVFSVLALIMVPQIGYALTEPLPQRINFQHPLENKDIALGEVQAFLQDSQGFMWIGGGGGLIRYDGYEFKFILQTLVSGSHLEQKTVKMVAHIYEDHEHILWISTRTGLLRYDPRTELLIPIPDDPNNAHAISTTAILDALELPTGELLLSTGAGILVLDRHTYHYWAITPDATKKDWLTDPLVSLAIIDKAGTLWLGTGTGLAKLDWATKKFTFFKPYPERPDLREANTVNDIVIDKDGSLWLGTSDGLVNFDPKTETRTRYINDPKDPNSIGAKEVAQLLIDSNGVLWTVSDGGGVAVFEKTEQFPMGHFINYRWEPGQVGTLFSNQVRSVFEDRTGDIWIGTYPAGINYFDRSKAAITSYTRDLSNPNSLSQNAILAVREDAKRNLWLGTDGGGLDFFDREKNHFTIYKNDPANVKSLSGDSVLDDFIDAEGKVWAGTWGGGISILDPATGEFNRMPFDVKREKLASISTSQRLNDATVWSIKEDRQNNLWIGTHYGGLSKFDRKTATYTHYVTMPNDSTCISPGPVWGTLEDSKGRFWVGTAGGLELMDRTTGTFKHFKTDPKNPHSLSNLSATALLEDRKQRLWIGTEAGLNLLNPDGESFTVYNKSSGFNDDNIRTILEGDDGQLWLATNNGVSVFNPETTQVKNYNRDSGRLMGGFHTDSGIISSKGEVIFGGVEGLRIFDPKKMKDNKVVPPIAFTGLKIFADAINVGGPDGLLPQSLNHTKTLVLDHTKSMFQVSFTALNFRDSSKNNYAYSLEGFDENWLQVGDQRSAKYTNLNAGTYVFHVKGSNNDGTWNDTGTSITIVQLPPPWKTWWAYTLYGLIFVTLVIGLVHSQFKKRRAVEIQNRLLEIKVMERTVELREKNKDIQTMLSNIHQGLFTIIKGGNIHPEYSHFLEDIFETNDIAGVNALVLLFGNANLGSNDFDQIKSSVGAIVGEDEVNYQFNAHLLITEYEVNFNGKSKYLSLDWNPVIVENEVVKLMVSVRDVTLLKKMESDALSKKFELDIISQLLNISANKYFDFVLSVKRFIEENRMQVEMHELRSEPVIALLFRNMHTIKGNSRTFNLDAFCNVVHEVESVYSELKANPETAWNRELLLSDLVRVESILQQYENVYYNVLGRGNRTSEVRDKNGFWADSQAITTIQQTVDAAYQEYPMLQKTRTLLPIQSLLNHALSTPIRDLLNDIIASLSSIALQLNKDVPRVVVDDNQVRIKYSATELITNIFAHILRNAVDHGIETAAVRMQAGKPRAGTIEVRVEPQPHCLHIYVQDDGQGVNVDRLFKKGVEVKRWTAEDKPSYIDIANLIFASGVSTKQKVTNISGRGVGMDAVKEFLLAQGGNVSLQLLGPNAKSNIIGEGVMVSFELMIELPLNTYTL